jgi:hypothetical protein
MEDPKDNVLTRDTVAVEWLATVLRIGEVSCPYIDRIPAVPIILNPTTSCT